MLKFLTSFFKAKSKESAPAPKAPYKVEVSANDKVWDFPASKKSAKATAVKKDDKPVVKAASKSRTKSKKSTTK